MCKAIGRFAKRNAWFVAAGVFAVANLVPHSADPAYDDPPEMGGRIERYLYSFGVPVVWYRERYIECEGPGLQPLGAQINATIFGGLIICGIAVVLLRVDRRLVAANQV